MTATEVFEMQEKVMETSHKQVFNMSLICKSSTDVYYMPYFLCMTLILYFKILSKIECM